MAGERSEGPCIDDIKLCKDECLVVACNGLTGSRWHGSVQLHRSPGSVGSGECLASQVADSTVAALVVLTPTSFLAGLDSGALELLRLSKQGEGAPEIESLFYQCDHDAGLTSLALSTDGCRLASAGWDHSIKIWDLRSMQCTKTYVSAHADVVWKVAFSADPHVFISCGRDGQVRSWDIRLSRPATILGHCPSVPRALDWQPQSPSTYAVGLECGQVVVRDLRQPGSDVTLLRPHRRPIHRLLFCPVRPSWLASCADDCLVALADTSRTKDHLVYKSQEHTEFVRGLAWDSGRLLSSGWDGRVHVHAGMAPSMQLASGEP
ncbi:unnamed protein product [Ixodes persulcatus]